MKNTKFLIIALAVIVLCFAGCNKSSGGITTKGGKVTEVKVDLSQLPYVINEDEFPDTWEDLAIPLPKFPDNIDWKYLNRVRIQAKYYWDDMDELDQENGMAMVTLIYDPDGDWRGPEMGPGPNTPLKAMNVGGISGTIHTANGSRLNVDRAPGMILFQNANPNVAFIEVTEITFFRRD